MILAQVFKVRILPSQNTALSYTMRSQLRSPKDEDEIVAGWVLFILYLVIGWPRFTGQYYAYERGLRGAYPCINHCAISIATGLPSG